jgi:predicted DNA repair protein MutK
VRANRELPVVWAVALGSMKNKVILVPLALLLNALAPWAVTPLLMLGGAYLCFEGFEKLAHKYLHSVEEVSSEHEQLLAAVAHDDASIMAFEKEKIKGAVRTDFVLSAEIIIITLGTVASAPFSSQVTVLAMIAVIMTIGVYGLVAAIVKLDDVGLYLKRRNATGIVRSLLQVTGNGLLAFAPRLMKSLTVIGTIAMFMVGGGILTHGIHAMHDLIQNVAQGGADLPLVGGVIAAVAPSVLDMLFGIVAGALVLVVVNVAEKLRHLFRRNAA